MSDTNVVTLPGVFRPDMDPSTPIKDVLTAAIDAPLDNVIVIGRVTGSGLYIAAGDCDSDKVIGQLMRAVTFLAEGEQVGADD